MEKIENLIGKYMVCEMHTITNYTWGNPLGTNLSHNGKRIDIIWAPMLIEKSQNHDISYKVRLKPVGLFNGFITDRAWYTCDIETRQRHNPDIKVFDTEEEATEYAFKLIHRDYPTPKESFWSKVSKQFNELWKKFTLHFN